ACQSTSPCQPETSCPWTPAAWAAGAARAAVAVPRAAAPSTPPLMSDRREGPAAAGAAGGGVGWRGRYGDMASPGGSRDAGYRGATVVTPRPRYGLEPVRGPRARRSRRVPAKRTDQDLGGGGSSVMKACSVPRIVVAGRAVRSLS